MVEHGLCANHSMIIEFIREHKDSGNTFVLLRWRAYALEDGGQAHHFITTITEEGDLSTWVWALPLACAKLGGGAPVSYHHHFLIIIIYLSSILSYFMIYRNKVLV